MSSDKYIENVTLEYLLNPSLQNQLIKKSSSINKELYDDIKFYKKRIIQKVKDYCKEINENNFTLTANDNVKLAYLNFVKILISDLKFQDTKDILQQDYISLENHISNDNTIEAVNCVNCVNCVNTVNNDSTISVNDSNISIDNILIKQQTKNINLDSFVQKKNCIKREILPNKRETNLQEPHLKYKGVKKKNINNI